METSWDTTETPQVETTGHHRILGRHQNISCENHESYHFQANFKPQSRQATQKEDVVYV